MDLICHSRASANISKGKVDGNRQRRTSSAKADPLSSYSPAAAAALNESLVARRQSAQLRSESASAIEHANRLQMASHMSVNEGLTQKLAETITLKV